MPPDTVGCSLNASASSLPLPLFAQVPPSLEGTVNVTPPCGLLRGNEAVHVEWSFAPAQEKTYEARCAVLVCGGAIFAVCQSGQLSRLLAMVLCCFSLKCVFCVVSL